MRGRRLRAGARRRARRCTHVIRVLDDQLLFRVVAPEQLDLGFAVFNLVTLSGQVSAKSRRGLSFRARTHRPPGGAARGFRLPGRRGPSPRAHARCARDQRGRGPGARRRRRARGSRLGDLTKVTTQLRPSLLAWGPRPPPGERARLVARGGPASAGAAGRASHAARGLGPRNALSAASAGQRENKRRSHPRTTAKPFRGS